MPWEIDIDKCSDSNLRSLSSLIGYKWNTSLEPYQQRESIKLFCLIRKWRGTKFGLINLIRSFGQDVTSYYSKADLRGIDIVEYGSGGPETVEPNMYPGDLRLNIPELSTILIDAITDTKLAGTRLIFSYYIFIGIYHLSIFKDFQYLIKIWNSNRDSGRDSKLSEYGPSGIATTLGSMTTDQLTHRVVNGKPIASCQILTYYVDPWLKGFIFATPGLVNYRGYIEKFPTVNSDDVLYK